MNVKSVRYIQKPQPQRKGPASVLGQNGQQMLAKHGRHYICVHPCRQTLEGTPLTIQNQNESTQETQEHQQQQHHQERQHATYDSDSDEKT